MKKLTRFINISVGSREKYNTLVFVAALFLLPFVMIVIRPLSSTDTSGYYSYFKNPESALKVEASFLLIASLARFVSEGMVGFRLLLFIYASLSSIFLFIILRKSRSPLIAFFVYFSFAYTYQMCIQIRSGVANLIFLWAVYDIADRNPKQYYLKMLLAFLFHNSSVFFFLMYPLCSFINKHKKILFILPFLLVFLAMVLSMGINNLIYLLANSKITMLRTLYAYTSLKQYSEAYINPFNRISLFLMVIYYVSLFFIKKLNTLEIVSLILMAISIFCYFLGKFSMPIIAQRYPEAFNLILVIFLPLLSTRCKEKKLFFSFLLIYLALINIQYETLSNTLSYIFERG